MLPLQAHAPADPRTSRQHAVIHLLHPEEKRTTTMTRRTRRRVSPRRTTSSKTSGTTTMTASGITPPPPPRQAAAPGHLQETTTATSTAVGAAAEVEEHPSPAVAAARVRESVSCKVAALPEPPAFGNWKSALRQKVAAASGRLEEAFKRLQAADQLNFERPSSPGKFPTLGHYTRRGATESGQGGTLPARSPSPRK